MRGRVALALAGLAAVLPVGAAAGHPSSELLPAPERDREVPAERFVVVGGAGPAGSTVTEDDFTVSEGPCGAERPALGGAVAYDSESGQLTLTLTQLLGSGTDYCARLRMVDPEDGHEHELTWSFRTMPDDLPPSALTSVLLEPVADGVRIRWSGLPDLDRGAVVVLRADGEAAPGIGRSGTVVIGTVPEPGRSLVDTTARPGSTYSYAAYPIDRDPEPGTTRGPLFIAGRVTVPAPLPPVAPAQPAPAAPVLPAPVAAAPPARQAPAGIRRSPRLLRPGAVVLGRRTRPLVVRWRPAPRARFYNVQLFRGARKIMSTFPVRPHQRVGAGLLRPGRYTLRVWTGIGPKRAARYAPRPWIDQVLIVRP